MHHSIFPCLDPWDLPVSLFEQGHFLRLMVLLLGAMWAYAPVLDIYIYPRAGVYRYTFMII